VAWMGKKGDSGKVWWRIVKDGDQLGGLGVDGLAVHKWTVNCASDPGAW
jgi:hypothetical protein